MLILNLFLTYSKNHPEMLKNIFLLIFCYLMFYCAGMYQSIQYLTLFPNYFLFFLFTSTISLLFYIEHFQIETCSLIFVTNSYNYHFLFWVPIFGGKINEPCGHKNASNFTHCLKKTHVLNLFYFQGEKTYLFFF